MNHTTDIEYQAFLFVVFNLAIIKGLFSSKMERIGYFILATLIEIAGLLQEIKLGSKSPTPDEVMQALKSYTVAILHDPLTLILGVIFIFVMFIVGYFKLFVFISHRNLDSTGDSTEDKIDILSARIHEEREPFKYTGE